MGMTIDEAIKVIHKMLAYTDLNVRANLNADMIGACHMAIETMRKYQKIEEMLYEFKDMTFAPCLMKGHMCAVHEILNEVIEDGNDTTNTGSN